MGLVRERIDGGLVPPWVWRQHVGRYEWAARYCAGRRVIAAACGSGYGVEILLRGGAASVVGVDIDTDAVHAATQGFGQLPGVQFVVADVRDLPFGDASFDVYVSFETIEHVESDRKYLVEARRVLRRNGVFLLSTPNRLLASPGRGLDGEPYNRFHIREYVVSELLERLQAQFQTIRCYGQSPFGRRYTDLLARMGHVAPLAAVRMHQLRKLLTIRLQSRRHHDPRPMGGAVE